MTEILIQPVDTKYVVLKVYKHFKKRAETMGYEGQQRTDLMIEFFAGAATVYLETEHENSFLFHFSMLCIRGEVWLEDLTNE